MRKVLILSVAMLPLLAGGCLAKTAVGLATAPIKVAGKAADWATTSRDESDRNYGRKMRKAEAREGRERKKADRACRRDPRDCDDSRYRPRD
ncbi:MAG: hypothetical protein B7Y45_07535 [Sphingomonas sp. 28-66-16]|nr:MAG: hypothetical protein B7Y45_07535 [Sphingomonas sp. 28-66-16]